ncbi:PilW family protein [Psychrobacter sp. JCM 18900]|uniref:PilW family protein n=1 Tax=Psychrobacter sp. JCM 18900 TaxID=1298608 RepID=UPI000432A958|nr:prepilin-type N-terminal cleavage/methylation domain-containing protein [Psychrobacter sp. JCM 18900]GAF51918.1 type IV fimbrial biogenesis protein PilW [Psychrobacter sp. JCM 18900]
MNIKYTQDGFSLIELMISLTLGLLISAAVMQIYLTSVKTSSVQAGGADILEASIFGIQNIEKSVRLSNLGMADTNNPFTPTAGLVMTSDSSLVSTTQTDKSKNNMNGIKMGGTKSSAGAEEITDGYLTRSGNQSTSSVNNAWKAGNSNITGLKGSQLTIQYEAPQNMYDCEGSLVRGPVEIDRDGRLTMIPGQVVIERYFLNEVTQSNKSNYESSIKSYELRCDAGRYIKEDLNTAELAAQEISGKDSTKLVATRNIRDFGDAGEVVIPRVDYFGVLLGVEVVATSPTNTSVSLRYFTPEQYMSFFENCSTGRIFS